MKKISILMNIFILLVVLLIIGFILHAKETVSTDRQNLNQPLSIGETNQSEGIEADIPSGSEDNYIGEKLKQYAKRYYGSSNIQNGNFYLRQEYIFTPLCEEDKITSIEYYLENGTGTFMDPNRTSPYSDNVKTEPYVLEGNNQEGIYFSVYFVYENGANSTNDQKVKKFAEVLEKLCIRLTITYQDGSVKVRYIGFKLASKYNYYNLDMYELTLQE